MVIIAILEQHWYEAKVKHNDKIHNLYTCAIPRKYSKDSVTFVLYVDTTAELNVVFIIKIYYKYRL